MSHRTAGITDYAGGSFFGAFLNPILMEDKNIGNVLPTSATTAEQRSMPCYHRELGARQSRYSFAWSGRPGRSYNWDTPHFQSQNMHPFEGEVVSLSLGQVGGFDHTHWWSSGAFFSDAWAEIS